jgi:hypothetical protein
MIFAGRFRASGVDAISAQGISRWPCEGYHGALDHRSGGGSGERVVRSKAEDTVYTSLFDIGWPNAPHRVLRNRAVAEWEAAEVIAQLKGDQ